MQRWDFSLENGAKNTITDHLFIFIFIFARHSHTYIHSFSTEKPLHSNNIFHVHLWLFQVSFFITGIGTSHDGILKATNNERINYPVVKCNANQQNLYRSIGK